MNPVHPVVAEAFKLLTGITITPQMITWEGDLVGSTFHCTLLGRPSHHADCRYYTLRVSPGVISEDVLAIEFDQYYSKISVTIILHERASREVRGVIASHINPLMSLFCRWQCNLETQIVQRHCLSGEIEAFLKRGGRGSFA